MLKRHGKTRTEVNKMGLREIRVMSMSDSEVQDIGCRPRTKGSRKALDIIIDKAVKNLMEGRRWDYKVRD